MAATKDQGTGTVEGVKPHQRLAVGHCGQQRQATQQYKKCNQPAFGMSPAGFDRQKIFRVACFRGNFPDTDQTGNQNHQHWRDYRRSQQHHRRRDRHQTDLEFANTQAVAHAPHGLCHNRHRHQFQTLQGARWKRLSQRGNAQGQQDQHQSRGQRKTEPGGGSARVSGARHPQPQPNLTAGRARQKLAQGHQVGITAIRQPLSTLHKLVTKITQVSHRAAKRG